MKMLIEIDNEVWKELQKRAIPLVDTPNSVLRKLLELGNVNISQTIDGAKPENYSFAELLTSPNIIDSLEGKRIWRKYKGRDYYAEVRNGKYIIDDKTFDSPSGAAMYVSKGVPINGWTFWRYLNSINNQWLPISELR